MEILFAIDDTDNVGTPGSGHLAEAIKNEFESRGLGECTAISRHQLFVHERVPYTSGNSSMCFTANIQDQALDDVISLGTDLLKKGSVEGSDPGLCVAVLDNRLDQGSLIDFGLRAKREVLSKDNAYSLAEKLGVHLTEHGGTGDGVIGALAGVGLRLQGNDGRYRGWLKECVVGENISAYELAEKCGAECVVDEQGELVPGDTIIQYGMEKVKTVAWKGIRAVPVVKVANGGVQAVWTTLTKEQVRRF